MPELPEVETVRLGLAPTLEGKRIARVRQRRPDLRFPLPERFAARLTGRRVERLRRRGKYLLAHLDKSEVLLMHLGMSGRFTILPPENSEGAGSTPGRFAHEAPQAAPDGAGAHDHIVFETENGTRVVFTDPRRFGFMDMCGEAEVETNRHLKDLGPEPLGNTFSADWLTHALRGRRTSIKAALLDQKVVAGLGNIYVCEALFRARISPRRRADTIAGKGPRPTARAERLAHAIQAVLRDAIAAGGSSLRDYARTDGELGYFQHTFAVYDREDEPCSRPGCAGTVRRIVQANRSSFYCPQCQR